MARWVRNPLSVLAAIAYLPLLVTAPGEVGGDTKAYLTIDPSRLLARAPWLWQPEIGTGTVTHQNIGYLWPMGPWFWACDVLGVPMWLAQRLWLGSILFAAGAGTWWLVRRFVDHRLALVAGAFYLLSPYALHYSERMSVLLLPWAGLPWMVGLTARAYQRDGWRDPALFALVTMSIGGINATSIVLAGLAPVLWLVYVVALPASAGTTEPPARGRRAMGTAWRIGLLSAGTAAWWAAGLGSQGAYGLPILRYTETYETVANASTAPEALRGLGHWYFYGRDRIGPWVVPSTTYTENLAALTLSFVVPALALAGLGLVRFRHRAFFGCLVVVGTVVAVGAHPFDDPSPYGAFFKALTGTERGLAMRSTPRALPLVVLGMAVAFAAGTDALARSLARAAALARRNVTEQLVVRVAGSIAIVVLVANLAPLWQGTMAASTLRHDGELPQWWLDATAALDAASHDTRVLELPGIDFATYRWGNTVDPITPGLMDRPWVARELVPNGSPASVALLLALDRRYQEGVAEPAALTPIARLLGVGDILLRNDLQYERFNTPRPYEMVSSLAASAGLDEPREFGPAQRNDAPLPQPLLDARALAEPASSTASSPVATYGVENPLPIVRLVPAANPMVVAGDAEGLVDLAAEGQLDPAQAILFSASYAGDLDALRAEVARGAVLVVTDTNAKRAMRWGTIRDITGYVERADEHLLADDPTDNRLDVFPAAGTDAQTVTVQSGGQVWASAYGNPVSLTPEDRPSLAFDGDPSTAWRVGAFADARGERIAIDLDGARPVPSIRLHQAEGNRTITRVRVSAGGSRQTVELGPESWAAPGQEVTLGGVGDVARIEVEILATDPGGLATYDGYSGVGFAEITVPGVTVSETRRLPIDLLGAVGSTDLEHSLLVVLTRERADAAGGRRDPEASLARTLALPSARTFRLSGTARLAPSIDTTVLDRLTRLASGAAPVVRASSWLPGDRADRGTHAFDGDVLSWWTPAMGEVRGGWVEATLAAPAAPSMVEVSFAADGRHSVPAAITVLGDGRPVGRVEVADAPDGAFGTTRSVAIPVTGAASTWRFVVDEVHERRTPEWLGTGDYALPPAIAEVRGLPVALAPLRSMIDTGCRDDLVQVGGVPLAVRITGTAEAARAGDALTVESCSPRSVPAGDLTITTTPGAATGIDLDRLVLHSDPVTAAAGSAGSTGAAGSAEAHVRVTGQGRDHVSVEITGLREPTWLVLGQSQNGGWKATSAELGDLGGSQLVEGYANGWLLGPNDGVVHVTMRWTPQRVVWVGLVISAITALACLVIVAVAARRRPVARRAHEVAGPVTDHVQEPSCSWPAALVGGAATALLGLLILPSWQVLAVALGGVTACALRRRVRHLDRALALAAPALLLVAGAYTTAKEQRGRYRTDFSWPQIFDAVHILGMLAVAAVLALVVIEAVRSWTAAGPRAAVAPDDSPAEGSAPGGLRAEQSGADA